MKKTLILGFSVALTGCHHQYPKQTEKNDLPNIVYILADDLGYGDIGCFGAKDIATPNIDNIAKEGIQFTSFYSASPVCSPSRAGFLTGRLPQRMGIDGVFFPESFTGMPPQEVTIAEMLKEKKYATGIIGKWHLGHRRKFLPLQQGFDSYFGIPYSNDMASVVYMRGNDVVDYHVDQHYITQRYTKEAVSFIRQHKDQPFFLYLAHNMPHVPIYASEKFMGTSQRGLYGDVVQELDWSVGQVIHTLDSLHLLDNTLVVFSSDNGPWLAMKQFGGSAGILREGKFYTFEGGMRIPTVAMWKGHIPKGIVHKNMASQMDWFPTFAKISGIPLPDSLVLDGRDISSILYQNEERADSTYLYFNGSDLQCFREGKWKVKKPFAGYPGSSWKNASPPHDSLLINLQDDPGERVNLFDKYPDKARNLFKEMHEKQKDMGSLPPPLVLRTPADESQRNLLYPKN